MRFLFTIIVSNFLSQVIVGQVIYSGFIGKYPIELVTDIYSDGVARAVYMYKKFNDPIVIDGKRSNHKLVLSEQIRDSTTLTFDNFDGNKDSINGTWADAKSKKQLPISLKREYEINDGESIEWSGKEILQPTSLKDYYFKIVASKKKGDFAAKATGVKILRKKADSLIQEIDLDCQLMGLDNISVGDFNFDGIPDFAVFEQSHAGPNTSSLYFLYDIKSKQFYNSGFLGVSLEFDQESKTIFERNSSAAGTMQTTAEYKVIKNKMVLLKQHCYIWSEKKQDLVEHKMKDCQ